MTDHDDGTTHAGAQPVPVRTPPAAEPSAPGERPDASADAAQSPAASAPLGDSVAPASQPVGDEDSGDFVPSRVGCRTALRGWAGAHLHGAVRPRRRAVSRGRPPGRWC